MYLSVIFFAKILDNYMSFKFGLLQLGGLALGFSVFRIWSIFRSIFRVLCQITAVFRCNFPRFIWFLKVLAVGFRLSIEILMAFRIWSGM